MADQEKDYHKETHIGFTIRCDECGSERIYVDKTLGFSGESGMWGSIDLVCSDCGSRVILYGND